MLGVQLHLIPFHTMQTWKIGRRRRSLASNFQV